MKTCLEKCLKIWLLTCFITLLALTLCACNSTGNSNQDSTFVLSVIAICISLLSPIITALATYNGVHDSNKNSFAQFFLEFANNSFYVNIHNKLVDLCQSCPASKLSVDELKEANALFSFLEIIACGYRKIKMFSIAFDQIFDEIAKTLNYFSILELCYHDKNKQYAHLYKLIRKIRKKRKYFI